LREVFILQDAFLFHAEQHDVERNAGYLNGTPYYGEPGINQYGPNPKGIGNVDEIDEIGNYLQ